MQPAGIRPQFTSTTHSAPGNVGNREAGSISLKQLAHEVNSLLDGALRNLRLIGKQLAEQPESDPLELVSQRIDNASKSMASAVDLLKRVMSSAVRHFEIFCSTKSIEGQIEEVLTNLRPFAEEHQVTLAVELTPRARVLPASILGPVIQNGVRNSIEACSRNSCNARAVELCGFVNQQDHFVLTISDTGIGIDSQASSNFAGHGIGLQLSHDIVQALGGELRLSNVPFGFGAILQIAVPLRRLMKPHA